MQEGYVTYLTEKASRYLYKTATWSSFFSVIFYIGAIIYLVASIGLLVGGGLSNLFGNVPQVNTTLMGIAFLPFAGLEFWCAMLLRRFSKQSKAALAANDETILEKALNAQKWFYSILGIVTIFSILILTANIIYVIVAGVSGVIG